MTLTTYVEEMKMESQDLHGEKMKMMKEGPKPRDHIQIQPDTFPNFQPAHYILVVHIITIHNHSVQNNRRIRKSKREQRGRKEHAYMICTE